MFNKFRHKIKVKRKVDHFTSYIANLIVYFISSLESAERS